MPASAPDWEAFYANYRKPGYVPGFEITSKLGGGMSGLVFKATRLSIGKDYAIKFLRIEDDSVRRAVLQELEQVRFFAQIDHPNLVSIEDRGDVDGIPYLVMAYAGSETLRERLPGRPEDRDELLRLFQQACRGVAALHAHALVHFDLKPANVFLKGGVARVGDYGLSKLMTHSRGSLSMGRGTPYYMAPEMLQRRGDHRSDVYSLGVMLFEILTGDVPFRGGSEWEVLRRHETAGIEFPAHVGPRERAIVERAMAKDPAQRFQSVQDLLLALGVPAAAGGGQKATRPEAERRAARSAEDPYAGLRDAARQVHGHAAQLARDALARARQETGSAIQQARRSVREALHGERGLYRRRRAYCRLRRLRRWQRKRDRALRAGQRHGVWFWLAVPALLFAVMLPFRVSGMRAEFPGRSVRSVAVGPHLPASDLLSVPAAFEALVSRGEPAWVPLAGADPQAARELLQAHLELLRAAAPFDLAGRATTAAWPQFGHLISSLQGREQQQMCALVEQLAKAGTYDERTAARLARFGRDALHFCAHRIEGDLLQGEQHRMGEHLGRFLREQTGFDGITLFGAEVPEPQRSMANRRFGAAWRWFLNEFALTEATWQAYQRLAGQRLTFR